MSLLSHSALVHRSLARSPALYSRALSTSRMLLAPQPTPKLHTSEETSSYQHHFRDAYQTQPKRPPPSSATTATVGPAPASETDASDRLSPYLMAYPVYSREELDAIKVVHHEPKTMGDRVARWLVTTARWGFDTISGYKHTDSAVAREAAKKDGKGELSVDELRKQGYIMAEKDWMLRILFLESIAGVPGFTAGMLRHLRSLRLMKRDGGWINSLLQEAENERSHLLTFLKIKGPSPFFRLLVLGAQGVFVNMFFFSYLISPKSCHRFVGYLEEEAVHTYTQLVKALERNEVPEWAPGGKAVPRIAIDYWRLPEDATMLDLVRAVRADEAGHRFVNHSFAELNKDDANPVSFKHASPTLQGTKPGFSREESLEWARQVEQEMTAAKQKAEPAIEEEYHGKK